MSAKSPHDHQSGSVQRSQVGEQVLEDVLGHPVEMPWIEIYLRAGGVRLILSYRRSVCPHIEWQDAVRRYAQVVHIFGLESGHG